MLSCVISNPELLQETVKKVCADQICVATVWRALSGFVLTAKK